MRFCTILLGLLVTSVSAQQPPIYTHADSIKGTYGPARNWWDVLHYDLHVKFNFSDSTIQGHNIITYKTLAPGTEMQLDLMTPLILDSVTQSGKKLPVRKDGNAHFISLTPQAAGNITAWYHGKPVQAKSPPWDGGVVWARDPKGNPWISVACQGMAAQAWFPNKDHMKDEPDSATMHFTVPPGQFVVSNGRLAGIVPRDTETTFTWKVKNPINNYNIIPYIGQYTLLRDTFNGKGGVLDLEYWVLKDNHVIAKSHFEQVKPMLRCFEFWFGEYPFYTDGYKLVEAPFLGMEHQSAIAYGNEYNVGYRGRDLSGTGWGLKWDFIVVHESGHEWFGNNISAADVADNWLHESFTAYSENLLTEWFYGKKAGAEYVIGTRLAIKNDKPVISDYNVNAGGSIDLYYKGANMLHTIRQIVNNDSIWRSMLSGMNAVFRHKTVASSEIEDFMKKTLGIDLQPVFDQYLRTTQIPVLEYRLKKGKLMCRWINCNRGFRMPVEILAGGETMRLNVTARKRTKKRLQYDAIQADPDYYVGLKKVQ